VKDEEKKGLADLEEDEKRDVLVAAKLIPNLEVDVQVRPKPSEAQPPKGSSSMKQKQ
jgi:hypothetical protein